MTQPQILPPEEIREDASWFGWPVSSWDDLRCICDRIENHTYCPVHGDEDVAGHRKRLEGA